MLLAPASGAFLLPDVLERMRDGLERALALGGDTHTLADVAHAIETGKAQLWDGPASVVITEIHDTPRRRSLHWWLAAGNLEELKAMEPAILAWGKRMGCDRATLAGRKGWERAWATKDWTPMLSVLEKEL